MNPTPSAVFVYGTLKRGERNFQISERAGWVRSVKAWLEGYQLFHIPRRERLPYTYPAVVQGQGRVWGEVQWFADLEAALRVLDVLEDEGNEYLRISVQAHLGSTLESHGLERPLSLEVWTYVYPHPDAILQARGIPVLDGVWLEAQALDQAALGEQ